MVTGMRWCGEPPGFRARVLVAAPHPDDEMFGCAGIMVWLVDHGHHVEIVAVTDGDASHARSTRVDRAELVARRQCERTRALAILGLGDISVDRLRFPDAEVTRHEADLRDALVARLDQNTTLVVPWEHDGHPDHEAVARAGREAAAVTGAGCLEVPIWARVRGWRGEPEHVLDLGAFRATKRTAIAEHRSQLVALGPDPCDGPVVHPDELAAMTSPSEWLMGSA
jgi:LmbE family N-acetylglucosaminyl deacetylase